MQYLVDKYDTDRKISYAPGTPEHVEQTCWLMFQMGGLGPMQGAFPSRQSTRSLSHIAKVKQITSVSLAAHVQITGLSGTLMRPNVSSLSLNSACKKVPIWRDPNTPLPTSRVSRGFVLRLRRWKLTCLNSPH